MPKRTSNESNTDPFEHNLLATCYSIYRDQPMSQNKTRNAWQSLAYSPLGAVVSPPSKYL